MVRVAVQAPKGQGEDRAAFRVSWRSSGWSERIKWRSGMIVIVLCLCSMPAAMAAVGVVHKQLQGVPGLASMSWR